MRGPANTEDTTSQTPLRIALVSAGGFWAVWLLLVSARAAAMGWPDQAGMFTRRFGLFTVGIVLTLLIHMVLSRLGRRSLPVRATTAFVLTVPATALFAVLNTMVFYRWFPVPSVAADLARWDPDAVIVTAIADGLVTWYFFFAAWAAFYLAVGYVAEVRVAEREAAASRAEAREARLAMLRLQVDPNFLFNAMNALSSLVARGENKPARAMIGDLAAFLRAGLSADVSEDIPLGDEIELQRLYLAIEKARFGSRLDVEWDIPDALCGVPVPALILQPLVENAVKYGVARTSAPVRLRIAAQRHGEDDIILSVEDNGAASGTLPVPASGLGIGLANVRSRLAARYGDVSALSSAATASGWRSSVTIPARG